MAVGLAGGELQDLLDVVGHHPLRPVLPSRQSFLGRRHLKII